MAGSELLFSTYFGGMVPDGFSSSILTGLKVDQAGNAYIAWDTGSTNFRQRPMRTKRLTTATTGAGFLAKFDIPPCTLSSTTPSITICAPPDGATAKSPVLIAAGATDDHKVTGMILYVDGVRKFSIRTTATSIRRFLYRLAHTD